MILSRVMVMGQTNRRSSRFNVEWNPQFPRWMISMKYYSVYDFPLFILQIHCIPSKYLSVPTDMPLDSKGFWRRCITLSVTRFLDFVHRPQSRAIVQVNYRPILSSERVPLIKKPAIVREIKEIWSWDPGGIPAPRPRLTVGRKLTSTSTLGCLENRAYTTLCIKHTYVYTDKRLNTEDSEWQTTDPTSRQRGRATGKTKYKHALLQKQFSGKYNVIIYKFPICMFINT
jgi:hypothetical protein